MYFKLKKKYGKHKKVYNIMNQNFDETVKIENKNIFMINYF